MPICPVFAGPVTNVEFYEEEKGESYQTTKWYKSTIIAYSKRGHVVTFNEYGPEHRL